MVAGVCPCEEGLLRGNFSLRNSLRRSVFGEQLRLSRSPRIRPLLVSAAVAAGLALAGCMAENVDLSQRAQTPLSPKMLADFEQKNMDKASPILVRIFKQEAELEVWKKDR